MSSQTAQAGVSEQVDQSATPDRRIVLKVSSGAALLSVFGGCESTLDPMMIGEESGEEAGEGAGEGAGEESGDESGEEAGEEAGDESGEEAGDESGSRAGEQHLEEFPPETLPLPDLSSEPEPVALFPYGVASGDPRQTSVTLWTALDPERAQASLAAQGIDPTQSQAQLTISWMVTRPEDVDFMTPLLEGEGDVGANSGYTYKVTLSDLQPDTHYRYRFSVLDISDHPDEVTRRVWSHDGLTRTLPERAEEIRLAFCSCANFSSGYYHAYRHLSLVEDLHVVVHLGDYIYESPSLGDRVRELQGQYVARDLETYRARYAEYRLDRDLQALHRAHPMIAVWDDHEFANGTYAQGTSERSPVEWSQRKAEGKQAYHEWLPTSVTPEEVIYRDFDLGGVAQLFMLDTRTEGRELQLNRARLNQRFDEGRQILGEAQERWLFEGLERSQAPWKLLGQQVMMSPLMARGALETERDQEMILNPDQWDGYASARRRFFDHIIERDIEGVVVCSGDFHTSWAAELCINPNDPAYYEPIPPDDESSADTLGGIALELITPAITSRALAAINDNVVEVLGTVNAHFKWYDLTRKGFMVTTLTPTTLKTTWYLCDTVDRPQLPGITLARTMTATHSSVGSMRLKPAPHH